MFPLPALRACALQAGLGVRRIMYRTAPHAHQIDGGEAPPLSCHAGIALSPSFSACSVPCLAAGDYRVCTRAGDYCTRAATLLI
jgi:hypothetical protein